MTDLTKDEVLAMATEAGFLFSDKGYGPDVLHTDGLEYSSRCYERFAALCRAPLVAEIAALKQAHEINADTLNAMQVEIDDWKARAEAELAQVRAEPTHWEVKQGGRVFVLNAQEFTGKSYDLASFKPLYAAPQPAAQEPVAFPMESAPRDSTLVRLLVNFEANSLEDSPDPVWTIGANCFDNDGIDEWKFAGWDWSQDCFAEGAGKPIGWLPMLSAANRAQFAIRRNQHD